MAVPLAKERTTSLTRNLLKKQDFLEKVFFRRSTQKNHPESLFLNHLMRPLPLFRFKIMNIAIYIPEQIPPPDFSLNVLFFKGYSNSCRFLYKEPLKTRMLRKSYTDRSKAWL
jgi:hypothetical protein